MKTKSELRRKFRDICRAITPLYREKAAMAAAEIFINQPIFKNSKHIACYLSVKGEFDCSLIVEAIWQAKKNCYVPVLSEEHENSLYFAQYDYGDALHANRYSILEPVNVSRKMAPEALDVVIVPLVAFDVYGHRLGTGGGYYDRTFAFLTTPQDKSVKKPCMLGIGYAKQQADLLPFDPWDIVLEGVITEQTFISSL